MFYFILFCDFFVKCVENRTTCEYVVDKLGGENMDIKNKIRIKTASIMKKAVNHSCKVDANSTTCLSIYQPKAPAALKNYSKYNKE